MASTCRRVEVAEDLWWLGGGGDVEIAGKLYLLVLTSDDMGLIISKLSLS